MTAKKNKALKGEIIDAAPAQAKAPKICLCLIVKNEAHILRRLLDSVAPVVDTYVIVDTGSSDDTMGVVAKWANESGVGGLLTEALWQDFGTNRSEALALAREHMDGKGYTLMLDADEQLVVPSDWQQAFGETKDVYLLPIILGQTAYRRRMVFSNAKPWRFEGVIHEYATCAQETSEHTLATWKVISEHAGARSKDKLTYARDAAALQKALIDEPDNTRYTFYLAQSYFDIKDDVLAKRYYLKRLTMGGWQQELFFSALRLAMIAQRTDGEDSDSAVAGFLAAYQLGPNRPEPLYHLGMIYRKANAHVLAHMFLLKAITLPYPDETSLFVAHDICAWAVGLEFAVSAYYVGQIDDAIAVNKKLLSLPDGTYTLEIKNRIEENLRLCLGAKVQQETSHEQKAKDAV